MPAARRAAASRSSRHVCSAACSCSACARARSSACRACSRASSTAARCSAAACWARSWAETRDCRAASSAAAVLWVSAATSSPAGGGGSASAESKPSTSPRTRGVGNGHADHRRRLVRAGDQSGGARVGGLDLLAQAGPASRASTAGRRRSGRCRRDVPAGPDAPRRRRAGRRRTRPGEQHELGELVDAEAEDVVEQVRRLVDAARHRQPAAADGLAHDDPRLLVRRPGAPLLRPLPRGGAGDLEPPAGGR